MKHTPPLTKLSDEEVQARIDRFSAQMIAAQERFKAGGSIADRAERDQCWLSMRSVLHERARRRRIVERMERERGLA